MDADVYCQMVEEKDLLNKQTLLTMPVIDDKSPLVSLQETEYNLMFEPSMMEGYEYLVREALVEKIGRISRVLDKMNKVLIIRSVWRSFEHQTKLWDSSSARLHKMYPERTIEEINKMVSYFIAPPSKSMHATGGAVDALIFDNKTAKVLDFGTNDGLNIDLNKKCYPYHPDITYKAKQNRTLLIHLFEKEDFVVDVKEYWHFDNGNAIWAIETGKEHAIYAVIKE